MRRSRTTASSKPGAFTSTDTELTVSAAIASSIPAFTPGEIPKSSAVMTSRTLSNVLAAPSIPPNLGEVPEETHRIHDKADAGWLIIVAESHRDLTDAKPSVS